MNLLSRIKPAFGNPRYCGWIVLMIALAGCGREEIKVYRLAKRPGEAIEAAPAAAPESQAPLTWKTPADWTEVPPAQMRVASFTVKNKEGRQADVSVVPLPGSAGGDSANVNRWRDQVSQPPLSGEELSKLAEGVEISGQRAQLYDVAGKNRAGDPTRILGAVQHREGTAWFFKMTGDDALVAQQKPAFIEFLKSTKFAATAAAPMTPPMPGSQSLPAGHPDISSAPIPAATETPAREGKPDWRVPADWKEVPGGQILFAKFMIAGDGGAQAAVNVSTSTGDGGGLAANVNRWRQQLTLPPVEGEELNKVAVPLEVAGGKAVSVELSGTDARSGQPSRVVGAIVSREGQTWFYKLMGDPKIVGAQKDAFTKFVQTIQY